MVTIPTPPPPLEAILEGMTAGQLLAALDAGRQEGEYAPWNRIRFLAPPDGLTHQQWWAGVKLSRRQRAREVPLRASDGASFTYALPDVLLESLDDVSRRASGSIAAPDQVTSPEVRDRYVVRSLMEESISSSQLEGAVTTARVAKEMLRTGRSPRDVSERMIVNNFRAMRFVREHADDDITPTLVCELHQIVTAGTLENPADAGRLQLPGDSRVGVWGAWDDVQFHAPPPAEELPERLAALCRFANGATGDAWLHPLLRAIFAHFMVGYDHYFVDGNGRTARALFYWICLKYGFWLMEFVTVSRLLKNAPTQYAQSFLLSEQDDGDLTYFALYHVGIIRRAIDDLHSYLARKSVEVAAARAAVGRLKVNHRQVAIIEGALRDSSLTFTAQSHATSHDVTINTARTDLRGLESLGLLIPSRIGRAEAWTPIANLTQTLHDLSN